MHVYTKQERSTIWKITTKKEKEKNGKTLGFWRIEIFLVLIKRRKRQQTQLKTSIHSTELIMKKY